MRCNLSNRRAEVWLALSLTALSPNTASLAKEPIKRTLVRRNYDFSRPRPEEILPNPTEGIGTPPQLRAYVTAKDMATSESLAGKEIESAPKSEAIKDAKGPEPIAVIASPSADLAPGSSSSTMPPADAEAWRSSVTMQVSRHVEATLAKQVISQGLDGHFAYEPSAAARNDPKIEALEQRSWDRIVRSLDTSWRAWQSAHPISSKVDTVAPRKPTAGRDGPRMVTSVPTAPGTIDLKDAPASISGDLPTGN